MKVPIKSALEKGVKPTTKSRFVDGYDGFRDCVIRPVPTAGIFFSLRHNVTVEYLTDLLYSESYSHSSGVSSELTSILVEFFTTHTNVGLFDFSDESTPVATTEEQIRTYCNNLTISRDIRLMFRRIY